MSVNRIGVQTLSDIQTRMQNKLGDPDQDRWTLADHINPAINDQLVEMARDMRMQHAGHAITTTNMTYSQGATGAELPAEIGLNSIFRVEDVTNQDIPVDIPYVSNRGIKAYGGQSSRGPIIPRAYTLLAPTLRPQRPKIQVSPDPTVTLTLRIHHALQPWVVEEVNDQIPFPAEWQELVYLGAMQRCLEDDDEMPVMMYQRLETLRVKFMQYAAQRQGNVRVRRRRKGIS